MVDFRGCRGRFFGQKLKISFLIIFIDLTTQTFAWCNEFGNSFIVPNFRSLSRLDHGESHYFWNNLLPIPSFFRFFSVEWSIWFNLVESGERPPFWKHTRKLLTRKTLLCINYKIFKQSSHHLKLKLSI